MTDERFYEIYRRYAEAIEADATILLDEEKQQSLLNSITDTVFLSGTSTDPRTPIGILRLGK